MISLWLFNFSTGFGFSMISVQCGVHPPFVRQHSRQILTGSQAFNLHLDFWKSRLRNQGLLQTLEEFLVLKTLIFFRSPLKKSRDFTTLIIDKPGHSLILQLSVSLPIQSWPLCCAITSIDLVLFPKPQSSLQLDQTDHLQSTEKMWKKEENTQKRKKGNICINNWLTWTFFDFATLHVIACTILTTMLCHHFNWPCSVS